ncbi:PilZ domain-containing protein [Thermodesulfobacteriota bacterium]
MFNHVEKRGCKRFQIPTADSKYKKTGLLSFKNKHTRVASVRDISKRGLSFTCDENLRKGQKLNVQLIVPNEKPIDLYSQVCWAEQGVGCTLYTVCIKFMPFGKSRGYNPVETLDALRGLEEKYLSN